MSWLVLVLSAVAGGIVQTVTGFGAAVVMMLFLPSFLGMLGAPAIVQTICAGLSIPLAIKFRKQADWKACLFPAAVYIFCSAVIISLINKFDLNVLKLLFGCFLILLSAYFFFFSKSLKLKANWQTAVIVSVISGIFSGLFGIGGPLMAVYFLAATDSKEEYVGTSQMFFAICNIFNLIVRCVCGIFTVSMIPMTLVGILAINVGKKFGLIILDRLNAERMRKLVYAFVGISGIINVVQYFL